MKAYNIGVEHCRARRLTLLPGHMSQARDDVNEWFDRTYGLQVMLDATVAKR